MAMPATSRGWTAEMVRALPEDGKRYEVIDGELFVTPAPVFDHQEAVGMLFLRLYPYMRGSGIGHATLSPADIEMSDEQPSFDETNLRCSSRTESRSTDVCRDIR